MMSGKQSFIGSLISYGALVLIGVATAFGVNLSTVQIAALTMLAAFIGILVTIALWAKTVPKDQVLEVLIGDEVVAGPANDIVPAGDIIRQVEPQRAAPDETI